jgi:transcriptional regulatory protein LevR
VVIITLCSTGEGGAQQIKSYLQKYLKFSENNIIPLAISDKAKLLSEVTRIQKDHTIQCLVGTYDPKISGIPFIPISKIFESDPNQLEAILSNSELDDKIFNTKAIYDYLDEQLEYVDVKKIKKILPYVMREINQIVGGELSQDQKLGLFIHIACSINRLLAKDKLPVNLQKDLIMSKYSALFKEVLKRFKALERAFGVIFSDDEIANVVSIIKKL